MNPRFADRFSVTRSRIVDEFRDAHPFRDLSDMRVVTRADVDRLSRASGWATRVGPGRYSFDWLAAERAVGRQLSPFEQRILRESIADDPDEVLELVDGLDKFLAE